MYWVIFCCPTSPSLRSLSSDGITTVSSCSMIDAVMYGMIPSAKIAKRWSEPPEKRLRKPRTFEPPKFSEMFSTASMLMPGAGM